MISRQIYGQRYQLQDLLDTWNSCKCYQLKACAARIIYWDFSFNFGQPMQFNENAQQFIDMNGIEAFLAKACSNVRMVVNAEHRSSALFVRNEKLQFQLIDDMNLNEDSNDKYSYYKNGDLNVYKRIFNLNDVRFNLPSYALQYNSAALIGEQQQEIVSLRQLAIEILSEMSNYGVYRCRIGQIPYAINRLVSLLKGFALDFVMLCNSAADNGQSLDIETCPELFQFDRLVNLFANLALDCDKMCMTSSRTGYFMDCFMDTECGQDKIGKRSIDATYTLAGFIVDELASSLLAVGDRCRCARTMRNIYRLFCNALPMCDKRIYYRLAELDFKHSLEMWISRLPRQPPVDNDEQRIRDSTARFMIERSIMINNTAMTELLNTHRIPFQQLIKQQMI